MPLLSPGFLLTVLLVFVRVGGVLVAAPFFKQRSIPVQVKVFIGVLLAYILAGLVPAPPPDTVLHPVGFIVALAIEAGTGLLLGFAANFIFWGVQFAGEVMGFQMALSMAQVFDPVSGVPSNPLGRLLSLSFLLVFVLLDGHHLLIQALVQSFTVVPLAGANLAAGAPLLLEWMSDFFAIALKLSAPFMITIFLIDVSLGIFARIVPQANLFMLGLPIKLLAGLLVLYFYVMHFFPVVPHLIERMMNDVMQLIMALAS